MSFVCSVWVFLQASSGALVISSSCSTVIVSFRLFSGEICGLKYCFNGLKSLLSNKFGNKSISFQVIAALVNALSFGTLGSKSWHNCQVKLDGSGKVSAAAIPLCLATSNRNQVDIPGLCTRICSPLNTLRLSERIASSFASCCDNTSI